MITIDGFELPEELVWLDEFGWDAAMAVMRRTIGGKPVLFQAAQVGGRPVTLGGEQSWISRADLLTVRGMVGHGVHALGLHDGRVLTVRWRLRDAPVLDVEQLHPVAWQQPGTWWVVRGMKLETT